MARHTNQQPMPLNLLIAAWSRWEAEPLEQSADRILNRKAYREGPHWEAIQRFAAVKAQAAALFRALEAELSEGETGSEAK